MTAASCCSGPRRGRAARRLLLAAKQPQREGSYLIGFGQMYAAELVAGGEGELLVRERGGGAGKGVPAGGRAGHHAVPGTAVWGGGTGRGRARRRVRPA